MRVFIIGTTAIVAALFLSYLVTPKDDTDPPGFWGRSGLTLYVDHRTGCHYLSRFLGDLTPRLDAKGAHMCEGYQ